MKLTPYQCGVPNKDALWAEDAEEDKLYYPRSAPHHVYRKTNGQWQYRKSWDTDWIPCNPDKHTILFPYKETEK